MYSQKTKIYKGLIALVLFSCLLFGSVHGVQAAVAATNTETSALLQQIQSLMKIVLLLQAQLKTLQGGSDDAETPMEIPSVPRVPTVHGPGFNAMDCSSRTGRLPNGALACYGIWDYGDEFGDDQNNCGDMDPAYRKVVPTGCVVPAKACMSNRAVATKFYRMSEASPVAIEELAHNLQTSKGAVQTQIINIWEYNCTSEPLNSLTTQSIYADGSRSASYAQALRSTHDWSFVKKPSNILIAGVYEAERPESSMKMPRPAAGEITVDVSSAEPNTLLVLSAYESVHWTLTGKTLGNIKAVYVTGYEQQTVSGLSSKVPVTYDIYDSGSDGYFIVYNGTGTEDDQFYELQSYLLSQTGYKPTLYFGGYSTNRIVVGTKE